ncbi:L-fucose:H+ symporter permease [Pseudoalteromonas phenolica]|uniref:Major facilitator transporter n=1 Tax=Pseudoalteromonas phenolica TaxID=161398 RepID=A0A0S2K3E7_9GAMM|nr:L-fucose:H+ symporter permease [Pseudoalteromonas phenolica]ALO42860.1 major facilitator transporter [Pseudoalteromonas phenolica]MBE0356006.1 MFS transporter, FHS family, L-fucose permease [Pseudoalteromonas phenolica O-BC30]
MSSNQETKLGKGRDDSPPILTRQALPGFLLVAMLFPLWGFVNDVTNPLVNVFKDIFMISNAQSSLVQFAFYFGYGAMAIPAALFIRYFSYKAGILLGLAIYTLGALMFVPATYFVEFYFFLCALFIATTGLALLEVTCNPYILSMGAKETATRRLNLAQAFNPIGSLLGMTTATIFLNNLQVEAFKQAERNANPEYQNMLPAVADSKISASLESFAQTEPEAFHSLQLHDLMIIREPYIIIAAVVMVLFLVFLFTPFKADKNTTDPLTKKALKETLIRLKGNRRYLEGIITQACYVGAQIMCWTFIIHYGVTNLGMPAAEAQKYNIVAMIMFLSGRFICTFALNYIRAEKLLCLLAATAVFLTLGCITLEGYIGLYCLVLVSLCMSLMYPTIYGLALKDLDDDASLASAGLVMAIMGGALMPLLQGTLIDILPNIGYISSVQLSFIVPMLCLSVVCLYGYRCLNNL